MAYLIHIEKPGFPITETELLNALEVLSDLRVGNNKHRIKNPITGEIITISGGVLLDSSYKI